MKQDNDDISLLVLVCIYEHCRFRKWKEGPRLLRLVQLLKEVYRREISINEIADILSIFGKLTLLEFKKGELFLTNRGRATFNEVKSSIIPPQTVAQPRRRN